MKTDKRTERCADLEVVYQLLSPQLVDGDFRAIHILRPMADIYRDLNQPEKAEPVLRAILQISLTQYQNPVVPSVHDARLALATTLQQLHRFREAIDFYKGCMFDNDCDSTASSLFHCLLEVNDWKQAVDLAEEYIARANSLEGEVAFTNKVNWFTNYSNYHVRRGFYAKAAEQFENVIRVVREKSEAMVIPFLDRLSDLYQRAHDETNYARVRDERSALRKRFNY